MHLLSAKGDTCSTSATWSYRQQDLEEKDDLLNQSVNDKALCSTAPATPGLLKIYIFPEIDRYVHYLSLATLVSSVAFVGAV